MYLLLLILYYICILTVLFGKAKYLLAFDNLFELINASCYMCIIVQQINGIFQENHSNWYRSIKFGTDTL